METQWGIEMPSLDIKKQKKNVNFSFTDRIGQKFFIGAIQFQVINKVIKHLCRLSIVPPHSIRNAVLKNLIHFVCHVCTLCKPSLAHSSLKCVSYPQHCLHFMLTDNDHISTSKTCRFIFSKKNKKKSYKAQVTT